MLTPQEVTNSVFEKALLGGYDTASVDKFMAQLTQDYSALYRENGILKAKMKVLVDKVEDYRSTEDSMRMALLQAEKTAKEIRNEADKQVEITVAEARAQAEILKAEGDAEYMRILSEVYDTEDEADFYTFMIALDALKTAMTGEQKTLVLDSSSPIAQLFK